MKLKATPGDFVVREESLLSPDPRPGAYAVYRLSKSSWDTFDLVAYLARRLGVRREDIRVGGMKDRHGDTEQLISVRGLAHPPEGLAEGTWRLRREGFSDHPVSARDTRGNRFTITLRDLTAAEAARAAAQAADAARDGFPNYFDAQRFGSARHGEGFMGKEIFLGHRERAVRLFFTPSKHDDRRTRELKRCVIENWGHWDRCTARGFGAYGRLLEYLRDHRVAFHQALALLDRSFLVLVLNAYQSFLFNEVLSRWLLAVAPPLQVGLTPLRAAFGTWQMYGPLGEDARAALRAALLPVPGHDSVVEDPLVRSVLEQVLAAEGIGLPDLRVRQISRIRVGGVDRPAVAVPEDLRAAPPEPDDLYPGRVKLTLGFFLPRGCYATVLVKRLMLAPAAR